MKSAKIPQKILIAVVAVLLFVCGSVVTYFLILLDRNATAFDSNYAELSATNNAVVVPELWSGSKISGSFNSINVKKLLEMLANDSSGTHSVMDTISLNIDNAPANNQGIQMITASDLRRYNDSGNVSGKSIVVTLGGYKWIVTCLSKDTSGNVVATLWLDDALSTKSTVGDNTSYRGSNDFVNGYPTGMYGTSYIRSVTLNNGGGYLEITSDDANPTSITGSYTSTIDHELGAFTASTGALVPYIVQPQNMPYQTVSQGKNNGGSYVLMNESLATNLTGYNSTYTFQDKEGYTAWGTDTLWLPSIAETGYNNTYQGIWQTSQAERSNSVSFAWLRSCPAHYSVNLFILSDFGAGCSTSPVFSNQAVRPALHLNLTSIYNSINWPKDDAVEVGELWNGDKTSGSFDKDNAKTLIKMLANSTSGTVDIISKNIDNANANNQGIKMINATDLRGYSKAGNEYNKRIVVSLGGYKWMITCLSKDNSGNVVATLWLDDALSTLSTFGNSSSYYGKNDFVNGYPTGMYGTSYMRSVTLNNGGGYLEITSNSANPTSITGSYTSTIDHELGAFTASTGALVPYIVQPQNMPYQTVSQGKNNGGSYVLMNESLSTKLTGYNSAYTFQDKEGYTAWGTDTLWIPSLAETGRANSYYAGIWKLSQVEKSNTGNYHSWLRSCDSGYSTYIYQINSGLDASFQTSVGIKSIKAVRPALHLNLTMIDSAFDTVEVGELWNGDKTSGSFDKDSVETLIKMLSNSASGTINTISANIDNASTNNQGINMINATDLRGYSNAGKGSGKSIVVTLGGYKWLVTCLSKDSIGNVVATLWLEDALSTLSTLGNSSSYYGTNSFTSGYPTGMYGTSYMRSVTLNNGGGYLEITSNSANPTEVTGNYTSSIDHIFGAFTASTGALVPYIVQPQNMPYQTVSQGKGTNSGISYVLMNESLATDLTGYYSTYTFQDKEGYTAWGTDTLWLPSMAETGRSTSYQGIWQTSQTERSNSVGYAWTRSCSDNRSGYMYYLYSSGDSYSSSYVYYKRAVRPALHLNLTAIIQNISGFASLDQQGGSGGSTIVFGELDKTLPAITTPTKTGYTFGGYFTGINGTGEQYYSASGESLKNFSTTIPNTLYAYWTASSYTVTFEYNGATSGNSLANKTVTYNSLYSDLPTPSKSSSAFGGWYLESTFQNLVTSTTVVTKTQNHTLYAKWTSWLVTHVSGTSTTVTAKTKLDQEIDSAKIIIYPQNGQYVQSFSFDNVTFYEIAYTNASISSLSFALSATYEATMTSNIWALEISCIFPSYFDSNGAINLYLVMTDSVYSSLRAGGGSSVSGVAVSATLGGCVTIVGDDYENLEDTDTITVRADVTMQGYQFDGWYLASDMTECLSNNTSERFSKELVYESQLVAKFSPIADSENMNTDTNI